MYHIHTLQLLSLKLITLLVLTQHRYYTLADTVSIDSTLLHDTYTNTFRLRDGSALLSVDATALTAMRGSVQRLLAVGHGEPVHLLNYTRDLPDDRLLSILLLAVAGNFTVAQTSALPQRCGIVVDPGSGALVLRDNAAAQSVILEVLLIVSIVCLVRAWGGVGG